MKHLKEEFDKLSLKEVVIYSLAVVSMVAGLVLLFLSLFIEPEGEIHQSVIVSFGLILTFVSALLGISMHYSNELDKFKSAITDKISEITK